MPTYEYRCPKGHEFEKFFPSMNDRSRLKCPKCGRMAERLISGGTGLHFKGSGFYITDYGKSGSKPASEGTSESKPESKSETKSEKPSTTEKPKPSKPKDK